MMPLPHHMDDALSFSQCLPEDGDKSMAEERDESLSPPSLTENPEKKSRTPRILTIREELVDLTGDPLTASLLGQMLYWCQKVSDFDLYIEEESAEPPKCFSELQYGWFYKAKQELIEETMLRVTLATCCRYMSFLRSRGWIQTRRNPENKLSSKIQSRVSLRKICNDLHRKGHTLRGFEAYGIFPHIPKDASTRSNKTNPVPQGSTSSKGK